MLHPQTSIGTDEKVLVIGLGNPILGDDGIGWKVVQQLDGQPSRRACVETDCLAVGGLGLMERALGYQRVILVDAIVTGKRPVGTVRVLSLAEVQDLGLGHSASSHDATLGTALQMAAAAGACVPDRVDIVAIEIPAGYNFTEDLTPEVSAAVPIAVSAVLGLARSDPRVRRHGRAKPPEAQPQMGAVQAGVGRITST
jgi:hydrogenase maturation protease